jgi:hypothetical protein
LTFKSKIISLNWLFNYPVPIIEEGNSRIIS